MSDERPVLDASACASDGGLDAPGCTVPASTSRCSSRVYATTPVLSANEGLLFITASRALLRLAPPYRLCGAPFPFAYIHPVPPYLPGRTLVNVQCAHGSLTSRLFSSPGRPTRPLPCPSPLIRFPPIVLRNTYRLHPDDDAAAAGLHGVTTCPYPYISISIPTHFLAAFPRPINAPNCCRCCSLPCPQWCPTSSWGQLCDK